MEREVCDEYQGFFFFFYFYDQMCGDIFTSEKHKRGETGVWKKTIN